jgi:hypothetical protein
MKNNDVRVVPVQQLCALCDSELEVRTTQYGLLARLCPLCARLVSEQVLREVAAKVVRV